MRGCAHAREQRSVVMWRVCKCERAVSNIRCAVMVEKRQTTDAHVRSLKMITIQKHRALQGMQYTVFVGIACYMRVDQSVVTG